MPGYNPTRYELSKLIRQDWGTAVAEEKLNGMIPIHKFGRNDNVGTSLVPICLQGNYRTPKAAVALEAVSDQAIDDVGNTGVQKLRVQGIGSDWREQIVDVPMNGTSAVALSTGEVIKGAGTTFLRVYRLRALEAGRYADQSQSSHDGNLIVRVAGAGAEWARIGAFGGFGMGSSQIGAYTVPKGYDAFVYSKFISTEAVKSANVLFFYREDADFQDNPEGGTMKLIEQEDGIAGTVNLAPLIPWGRYEGPCDIGFLGAFASGTGSISIDFLIGLCPNDDYVAGQ